jgi:hypothetical protein
MADLVRDNSGQFIFALGKGDQFARYIDASAGQHEGIRVRQIYQQKLEAQTRLGKVLDYPLADSVEMACDLLIIDHAKVALEVFGDGVAQIALLLLGENVGLGRMGYRRRKALTRLTVGNEREKDNSC